MKINFSPRPSLTSRLCRTFRGVFQARLCRCGGCYATGLENRFYVKIYYFLMHAEAK